MTGSRAARGSASLPGSRARPGEERDPEAEPNEAGERGPKNRPRGTAWDRALRLLSVRERSRRELERRLLMAGFEAAQVTEALDRLESAGLVDDGRFARAVVQHQIGVRMAGRRAVMSRLLVSGVDRVVAEEALAETGEEEQRARELAERRAARLGGLPPEVARRRLADFLMRRGYPPSVARRAAGSALGQEPRSSE